MRRHDTREQRLAELAAAGYTVTRNGCAWRIVGRGLDFMVADLRYLDARDLQPAAPDRE